MATPAIRVGDVAVHRVEEIVVPTPLDQLVIDPQVIAANRHWMEPRFVDADNVVAMPFHSWIVEVDDRIVVIDPCAGNGRPNAAFPAVHLLDTPYLERFEASGFSPADVDLVFCTHLHCDHCGWNTRLSGDRYVPTFPNARYLFVRREFDRWDVRRPDHVAVGINAGVWEASVQPIVDAGLAELVGDDHRLSPSLTVSPAWGHTRGHALVHLVAAGSEACFVGDAVHHPLELLYPDQVNPLLDEDPEAARATRRRIAALSMERDALVIAGHFTDPYAGWVRRQGDALAFAPYAAAAA